MGPEAEFFIFDDVRYSVTMNKVSYEVDGGRCRLEHRYRMTEGGNIPATVRASRAAISR
jgi:glutamine synthetase